MKTRDLPLGQKEGTKEEQNKTYQKTPQTQISNSEHGQVKFVITTLLHITTFCHKLNKIKLTVKTKVLCTSGHAEISHSATRHFS